MCEISSCHLSSVSSVCLCYWTAGVDTCDCVACPGASLVHSCLDSHFILTQLAGSVLVCTLCAISAALVLVLFSGH